MGGIVGNVGRLGFDSLVVYGAFLYRSRGRALGLSPWACLILCYFFGGTCFG